MVCSLSWLNGIWRTIFWYITFKFFELLYCTSEIYNITYPCTSNTHTHMHTHTIEGAAFIFLKKMNEITKTLLGFSLGEWLSSPYSHSKDFCCLQQVMDLNFTYFRKNSFPTHFEHHTPSVRSNNENFKSYLKTFMIKFIASLISPCFILLLNSNCICTI